jgi:hypothetical protein
MKADANRGHEGTHDWWTLGTKTNDGEKTFGAYTKQRTFSHFKTAG